MLTDLNFFLSIFILIKLYFTLVLQSHIEYVLKVFARTSIMMLNYFYI